MRKWFLLFPVLVLAGCAFVFTDVNTREVANVSVGMSSQEVSKALGEPLKVSKRR